MVLMLLMATPQASPVPPPITQMTADCVHPVYATDMLVCGDPELLALDNLLKSARAATPVADNDGHLIEEQAAWFRRSRRCAFLTDHRACAVAAYGERLMVIAPAASPLRTLGQCRLTDGTTAGFAATAGGAILTRDGRVIAVGLPTTPVWHPFVRYTRNKNKAVFRSLEGGSLAKCRIDKKGPSQ